MKFVLFFVFFSSVFGGLTIMSPAHLANKFKTPLKSPSVLLLHQFLMSGNLVLTEPSDACTPLINSHSIAGNIAFFVNQNCETSKKLLNAQNAGAIGIVIVNTEKDGGEGGIAAILQSQDVSQIYIEGVEIVFDSILFEAVSMKSSNVTALIAPDKNEYFGHLGYFIGLSIVVFFSSTLIVVLSFLKLKAFISIDGLSNNLSQICLFFNLLAGLERIAFSIDPSFAYGLYVYEIGSILLTGSFHLALCSIIIITFYWHKGLEMEKINRLSGLGRLKIPAIIVCVIICMMEIGSSYVRVFYAASFNALLIVSALMYIVISSIVTLVYFIEGARIMAILNSLPSSFPKNAQKQITRTTVLIIASGFGLVLFICGVFIYILPITKSVGYTISANYLVFIGLNLTSLTQILIFRPKFAVKNPKIPSVTEPSSIMQSDSTSSSSLA